MHRKQEIVFLRRAFSDAHVKDIDFSEWDRRLTFCVIVDHFEGDSGGRRPVYLINFHRVRRFNLEFKHLDVQLPEPRMHFQWQVDTSNIKQVDGYWLVKLSGLTATPVLELSCERIDYERVHHRDMDRYLPGWDSPASGFARIGIAKLIASRRTN